MHSLKLQPVCTDGVIVDPCHAKSPVLCGVQTLPELGREACSHQLLHCLGVDVPSIKAPMYNLASK